MNEEMMQFLQSLPPEKQQQLMASFQQQQPQQADPRMGMPGQNNPQGTPEAFEDFQGQGGIIDDQQAQAEALRGTPTPQGMQTANAGFVASNPLSHLAQAGQKIRGNMDARAAMEAKEKMSQTKTDALQKIAADQLIEKKQAMANALRGGSGSPLQGMAETEQRNPLMSM